MPAAQVPLELHVRGLALAACLVVELQQGVGLGRTLEDRRVQTENFVAHVAGSVGAGPETGDVNVGGCHDRVQAVVPGGGAFDTVEVRVVPMRMDGIGRWDLKDKVWNGCRRHREEEQQQPQHGAFFFEGAWY